MNHPIFKQRRHPNVMSESERNQLPDPCRPFVTQIDPVTRPKNPFDWQKVIQNLDSMEDDCYLENMDDRETSVDYHNFIQQQQKFRQENPFAPVLSFEQFNHWVQQAGVALLETVMLNYPQDYPNTIENKLLLMGQMYQNMLSIFLLCQCKSRKTLNYQFSLQDLSDMFNQYIKLHHQSIQLLPTQEIPNIEPQHIQFAVMALGWQLSQHQDIAQRKTNISSQNPFKLCFRNALCQIFKPVNLLKLLWKIRC